MSSCYYHLVSAFLALVWVFHFLLCSPGSSESSQVWLTRILQLACHSSLEWHHMTKKDRHIYFYPFFSAPKWSETFHSLGPTFPCSTFVMKNFEYFVFSHATFHILVRLLFMTFVCYHWSKLKEDICYPTSLSEIEQARSYGSIMLEKTILTDITEVGQETQWRKKLGIHVCHSSEAVNMSLIELK